MKQLTGACIIGQSGGPTAVINASAQGVIQTALKADCITRVLGAAHGIKGVLEDKLYDMGQEDSAELELLKFTPSSALGSCRYKLAAPDVDDADYRRILEVFKKYDVRYLSLIHIWDSLSSRSSAPVPSPHGSPTSSAGTSRNKSHRRPQPGRLFSPVLFRLMKPSGGRCGRIP